MVPVRQGDRIATPEGLELVALARFARSIDCDPAAKAGARFQVLPPDPLAAVTYHCVLVKKPDVDRRADDSLFKFVIPG